jgi:uncharacterized cupredoxin-like copper-binding protein
MYFPPLAVHPDGYSEIPPRVDATALIPKQSLLLAARTEWDGPRRTFVMHVPAFPRLAALAAAASLATAACASLPAESGPATASVGADGTQRVEVEVANELRFAPSSIVVSVGKPIELTLRNIAQQRHDFTMTEGVSVPVSVVVGGGESSTATFTFASPGTYHFICAQEGHAQNGMRGTIVAH